MRPVGTSADGEQLEKPQSARRRSRFRMHVRGTLALLALGCACTPIAAMSRVTAEAPAQQPSAESEQPGADGGLATAKKLIAQGKLGEAEAELRRVLADHEDSAMAHTLLGLVLYQRDKPAESLREFTRSAELKPPRPSELVIVALDYVKLRDLTSADRWLTLSVKENPSSAGAWRYLGGIKYSENRFAEALDAYRRCLQLRPQDVLSEDGIGRSLEGLGREEDAAAAYRQAIDWQARAGSKFEQPLLHLGTLLLHEGDAAAALPYLQQAEILAPSDADVHQALGESDLQLKKLPDAEAELEKAIAISPRDSHLHWLLASVYRREGKAEKQHAEERLFAALVGSHSNDPVQ